MLFSKLRLKGLPLLSSNLVKLLYSRTSSNGHLAATAIFLSLKGDQL